SRSARLSFSLLPPPPRPTPFPYTTLFRSLPFRRCRTVLIQVGAVRHNQQRYLRRIDIGRDFAGALQQQFGHHRMVSDWFAVIPRSEEHTSELQSLRHLVCRLLLEKKKKKT